MTVTNNTSSLSAGNIPSSTEGILLLSTFVLEAVLIVVGNSLTIVFFAFDRKIRKKSLFLVINMAFADVVLGALCLPFYLYVWVGPSYQLWHIAYEIQAPLLTFWDVSDTIFFTGFINFCSFHIMWAIFRHLLAVKTTNTFDAGISHCHRYGLVFSCSCLHSSLPC